MGTKIIQDDTLTDIADAIRSKTGKSATMTPLEMPEEIESISGGIENGIEILDYYPTGEIKEINWYGDVTPRCMHYFWYNVKPVTIHFVDYPTHINLYAMNSAYLDIDTTTLRDVVSAEEYAFNITTNTINNKTQDTLYLPNFTGESAQYQNSRFRTSSIYYYGTIILPKMQHIGDYDFYQDRVANQTIQFGSVGYPVTTCGQRPFGGSTGSGTITVYTTGELLDTISTAIQNQSGANYTFIYKASEATTYNGTSYNADDTMMTSTGA